MSEPGHSPSLSHAWIKILIVDDNPANLEAFESVIRPLGYSVFRADSGLKALELARQHPFSVILLDVRMPLMTGLETALELRRMPLSRLTPIIFVSAYEETQLAISRSGLEGFVSFIFSPVNSEVLTWKVQGWVEVSLRQEMWRRQEARMVEAQEALQEILGRSPIPEAEARQANTRLATALRLLTQSRSDERVHDGPRSTRD